MTDEPRKSAKRRFGVLAAGVVGWMPGKISIGKGAYMFMEAVSYLPRTVSIIICGTPNAATKRDFWHWFNNSRHDMRFYGKVSNESVLEMMRACDVYVHCPIYDDPLPRCVNEPRSVGTPIVATNVGGIPEAIEDGKDGFLVEPGDARGLADRIMRLLPKRILMGGVA